MNWLQPGQIASIDLGISGILALCCVLGGFVSLFRLAIFGRNTRPLLDVFQSGLTNQLIAPGLVVAHSLVVALAAALSIAIGWYAIGALFGILASVPLILLPQVQGSFFKSYLQKTVCLLLIGGIMFRFRGIPEVFACGVFAMIGTAILDRRFLRSVDREIEVALWVGVGLTPLYFYFFAAPEHWLILVTVASIAVYANSIAVERIFALAKAELVFKPTPEPKRPASLKDPKILVTAPSADLLDAQGIEAFAVPPEPPADATRPSGNRGLTEQRPELHN